MNEHNNKILLCDGCDYLNMDEAQQTRIQMTTGRVPDHICNFSTKRLFHNGMHPVLPRPDDCPLESINHEEDDNNGSTI